MKVLFTARYSLFSQPGGDTQQVVQTADALRVLGVEVDIILHGEIIDFTKYDLVHFFNFGRPADILGVLPQLKVPLIVSAIWVDYSEYDKYRPGFGSTLQKILGPNRLEYFKTIARGFNGSDKMPGLLYISKGHSRALKTVAFRASAMITSSQSEKQRITKSFEDAKNVHVIPLGLSIQFSTPFKEETERSGVICVGRIEGLKNQLNLIRAAKGADWHLKVIGKTALNQPKYYAQCEAEATENVEFVGWQNMEHLLESYRSAKVLVLPSFFETFGLVALEAMSQGCNVVIADRPDMKSIFNQNVLRCNPHDPNDIRQKIEQALELPVYKLNDAQRATYNWPAIAKQLQSIYKNTLS